MHISTILEWSATGLSLLGAFWVAGKSRTFRRRGFEIWIVANCLWMVWAFLNQTWGLFTLFSVYQISSGWGWWNNRAEPTAPTSG